MAKSTKKTPSKSKKPAKKPSVAELEAENQRLKRELEALEKKKQPKKRPLWQASLVGLSATIAVVCFMLFNIAFWTQRTIINTNQFVAVTSPIIKDPAVQKTLQDRISQRLFERIDVEARLQQALPENLAFAAGPLANQFESFTTDKIGQVLASQQVATLWTNTLTKTHQTLINYIQNPNADGVITVDDIYAKVGDQLTNSKIGFLFDKNLPSSIGSITVKQVTWLPQVRQALNMMHKVTNQLFIASLLFAALAIGFSKRRLSMVGGIAIFSLLFMGATLLALKIGSWQATDHVASQFVAATGAIYKIVTATFIAQTQGFAALFGSVLIILLAASGFGWVTWLRTKLRAGLDWLFATFAKKLTTPSWVMWLALNRLIIVWTGVGVLFACFALRLPPTTGGVWTALIASAVLALLFELVSSFSRVAKKPRS